MDCESAKLVSFVAGWAAGTLLPVMFLFVLGELPPKAEQCFHSQHLQTTEIKE